MGPLERQWYLERGRRWLDQKKGLGFHERFHSQMQLEGPVRANVSLCRWATPLNTHLDDFRLANSWGYNDVRTVRVVS